MKPATTVLLLVMCVAQALSLPHFSIPRSVSFDSAPPLANRKVHASYINSSSGPIRVVQVVNVNVLPVRVSPAQSPGRDRDVEQVEEPDNSLAAPAYGDERRTQVDVFVGEPGRRPPPLRLTDYELPLDSNQLPDGGAAPLVLPMAAFSDADAEFRDGYLDQMVDFALEIVRRDIHAQGKDQIPAPDIHKEFIRKLGPLQLKGIFDATGGAARNLSTLERTHPVVVRRVGATLQLQLGLGLRTLAASYQRYNASLGSLKASGQLDATVASDSIAVVINATIGQLHCVQLHSLRVDQLGKIDVKVTGLGDLSWLTSKVVTWLTDTLQSDVRTMVEEKLSAAVSVVLGRVKCSMQHYLSLSLPPPY